MSETVRREKRKVEVGVLARYVIAILLATPVSAASAEDLPLPQSIPDAAGTDPITDYFLHWFDRADLAQQTQPHWMTPITTVTPRLEQEFRYDEYQEFLQNGALIDNYFAGKGLELIPTETNEVLINVPPFEQRFEENPMLEFKKGKLQYVNAVTPATGFADWNAVTVKQRILSANEENGNYILTAFLGFQAPTGITAFTNRPAWIVTPTISGGMGWGQFDFQATIGYTIPTDEKNHIGNTLLSSLTLQYHFWDYFWPEFAFNDTQWTSGERAARNQLLVGPGIMFGRFEIYKRVHLNFGIAYQDAIVPERKITDPLTPLYNHAWILSARLTF